MRRTAALRRWLDDPGAGLHARVANGRVARAIHALPALAAFRARLATAGGDGEAVAEAVAALFADTGWPTRLIAILVEMLAADPFALPPLTPFENRLHQGLIVHDCPLATIALGSADVAALASHKQDRSGTRSIGFSGHRSRLRFIRAGGARLAFYRFDGRRCRPDGVLVVTDGAEIAVDGAHTGWIITHAQGDLLVLQASIKAGRAPLAVECDAETGDVIAQATTNEAASRLQMLVSMLAAMDRRDAAPAIAACLAEPQPFLRWHAMRELVALDPEAAMAPLMALAARDPDRQVRDAARRTAALLRPSEPCHA